MQDYKPPKKRNQSHEQEDEEQEDFQIHPHYQNNLTTSERFIEAKKYEFGRGIKLYIADSQKLPKSLLMITFTPPMEYPLGRIGVAVRHDQDKKDFQREASIYYADLNKIAKDLSKKLDEQGIDYPDFYYYHRE